MLRYLFLSISCLLLLTACGDGPTDQAGGTVDDVGGVVLSISTPPTAVPGANWYEVVREEIEPGTKRDLRVHLNAEVSKDRLSAITTELLDSDPRWYDMTIITFFLPLPSSQFDQVKWRSWAMATFDRTVDRSTPEVSVLGRGALPKRSANKPDFSRKSSGGQNVSYAGYQRIQTGMSYGEVVGIIGERGEELARNKMDGVPGVMESIETVMYQWVNDDGSSMNAMFQNNKLKQKAQFGLK